MNFFILTSSKIVILWPGLSLMPAIVPQLMAVRHCSLDSSNVRSKVALTKSPWHFFNFSVYFSVPLFWLSFYVWLCWTKLWKLTLLCIYETFPHSSVMIRLFSRTWLSGWQLGSLSLNRASSWFESRSLGRYLLLLLIYCSALPPSSQKFLDSTQA